MHDPELTIDILQQINGAAKTVLARFQPISKIEDFTHSDAGREKLDGICTPVGRSQVSAACN